MLTYQNLKDRVLRLLDEVVNPATQTENLVGEAINASHRRICLSRPWPFMKWPRRESVTLVSGTRIYALNRSVGRLLDIWNVTRREPVRLMPRRNWEQNMIDLGSSGVGGPDAIFGDWWPVAVQPSAATTLRIVSSSTSDGTGEQVLLRGIDSTGDLLEETLTANGTTQVTSSGSFVHVLNVSKIGTWAGTMTLSTTGAVTLLTLTASQTGKQYPTLEFIEPPVSADSVTYSFLRVPRTLSNDEDLPEIPFPYSELLVYDTLLDMATYNTDIGRDHVAVWGQRYHDLMKQLLEAQDETIAGAHPRYVRDVEGAAGHPAFFYS